MIASLPLFHRVAGHPIVVLGDGDMAEAKRRLVLRAGGIVVDDLAEGVERGARIAFIAHADAASAERDVSSARLAGMLVNCVDRPELCDFTTPALVERGPVLVAVGTGGASAGLAKALRLRMEAWLPATLGGLGEALLSARDALRARFPDAGVRRRALDAALGEGGALDPLRVMAAPAAWVGAWLANAAGGQEAGAVEVRVTSPDPEELTLRVARLLGSADVVAYEDGIPDDVLARARADAARVLLAKDARPISPTGLYVVLRNGIENFDTK